MPAFPWLSLDKTMGKLIFKGSNEGDSALFALVSPRYPPGVSEASLISKITFSLLAAISQCIRDPPEEPGYHNGPEPLRQDISLHSGMQRDYSL